MFLTVREKNEERKTKTNETLTTTMEGVNQVWIKNPN